MPDFLRYPIEKRREIAEDIGALVRLESPSESVAGIERCLDWITAKAGGLAGARRIPTETGASALLLDFRTVDAAQRKPILVLTHADTVWPEGTLARLPFREEDGRLWGPGVLDMKAGIVFFLWAMQLLKEHDLVQRRPVRLLVVPDEETGSLGSRAITEAQAKESEAVLVLEPGTGLSGKLKTARKGVGRYRLSVTGQAAHAGVDFEKGASAIVELAYQIERVSELTDLRTGTTANVGVIAGGTKSNVIAAEAHAEVDVRVVTSGEAERIEGLLRSLKARDVRCRLEVTGGLNRPPMERSEGIARLFGEARRIAAEMGIAIDESATGGGSDGNFTAAVGIPTLDGLGAVGEGAHADHESVLVDRIPDRVALLAGLLHQL